MTTPITTRYSAIILGLAISQSLNSYAQSSQPASVFTKNANDAVKNSFDLNTPEDMINAKKGKIAELSSNVILGADGNKVWDGKQFEFIKGQAPASVNPSLWRQETLNNQAGLFKVTDGIWQVRGYDIANMTLVKGKTGWIIIDPLLTKEAAKASLDLAMQHLGSAPVVAVIYTHSHIDHFGGVKGRRQ